MNNEFPKINDSWSLFLDRDGTINKRLEDDYVKVWKEFEFLPGVLDAMAYFNLVFQHIFIVTNQQGIGKELMTHEDLQGIHDLMMDEVWNHGGQVDQIYYCSDLAIYDPTFRKPNPGMAIQAKNDFPEVNYRKSIMIGDAETDIEFGNQFGMFTVRLSDKHVVTKANMQCESLFEFYELLKVEIDKS